MESIIAEKAKANMVLASHPKINSDGALQNSVKQPITQIETVNTQKEIAKIAQVSHDTRS